MGKKALVPVTYVRISTKPVQGVICASFLRILATSVKQASPIRTVYYVKQSPCARQMSRAKHNNAIVAKNDERHQRFPFVYFGICVLWLVPISRLRWRLPITVKGRFLTS